MEKSAVLKALAIVSTLFRMEEIDTNKKNKMLSCIMENDDAGLNKELHRVREFSSCRNLIDEYLEGNKQKGGNNYAEN